MEIFSYRPNINNTAMQEKICSKIFVLNLINILRRISQIRKIDENKQTIKMIRILKVKLN